jgi:hypothetical protein
MPIPADERVRQLCALISVAHGVELENAIAELRIAIRTLIGDVQNVSTYNLINFSAAMNKRKMDERKKQEGNDEKKDERKQA